MNQNGGRFSRPAFGKWSNFIARKWTIPGPKIRPGRVHAGYDLFRIGRRPDLRGRFVSRDARPIKFGWYACSSSLRIPVLTILPANSP